VGLVVADDAWVLDGQHGAQFPGVFWDYQRVPAGGHVLAVAFEQFLAAVAGLRRIAGAVPYGHEPGPVAFDAAERPPIV
jgi:hypothetical protein